MTTNCIGVFRYLVSSCLLCSAMSVFFISGTVSWPMFHGASGLSSRKRSGHPLPPTFSSRAKALSLMVRLDIYFDTADEPLAVADGSGAFSKIPIQAPTSADPGKHWVSAIQRSGHSGDQVPFTVNTNWNQFHFSPDHKGFNPFENVLGPSTVGQVGLQWSFPTVGQVESAPVEANGVVYFGAGFTVYALNATTGMLQWQYSTGSFVGGPAVAGHLVYVSSADHKVYALNARTGTLLWNYETVNGLLASVQCTFVLGALNQVPVRFQGSKEH